MSQEYGAKRLDFRHPPLGSDLALIGGGMIMLLLSALGASNLSKLLKDYFAQVSRGSIIAESLFSLVVIWAPVLFLIIGLKWFIPLFWNGLKAIYRGWLALVRVEMPAFCPKNFRKALYKDNKGSLIELYDFTAVSRRAVPVYEHFDKPHEYLTAIFGRNSMFLSPTRREVVIKNGDSLKRRFWFLLALLVFYGMLLWGLSWLRSIFGEVGLGAWIESFPQSWFDQWVKPPLGWLIGLNLVIGAVEFITSFMLVPSRQPDSVPHEMMEDYRGFGHPLQVLNCLPALSEKLALEGFPNRPTRFGDLSDSKPVGVSDTATFHLDLFIEQQPRPIPDSDIVPAYLMLGMGWLLALGGMYTYFFHIVPDLAIRELILKTGVVYALTSSEYSGFMWILAMIAMGASVNFIKNARKLFDSARFVSTGILVDFEGSLARSDVRVGKAMMDSVESSNVAVRSDFVARFWAAELISESPKLEEDRCLLEAYQTVESKQWIEFFRNTIHQLRDEGVKIIGVDLQATEVSDVMRSNIAAAQLRGAPAPTPGLLNKSAPEPMLLDHTAPRPSGDFGGEETPTEVRPSPDNYDPTVWKECPECAELVRIRAKKCRFCGYVFG